MINNFGFGYRCSHVYAIFERNFSLSATSNAITPKVQFSMYEQRGLSNEPVWGSVQHADIIIQIIDWTLEQIPTAGMILERLGLKQRWEFHNRPERCYRDHGDHHKEWRIHLVYSEVIE